MAQAQVANRNDLGILRWGSSEGVVFVPFRQHLVRLIAAGTDAWAHTAPEAVTSIELLADR